MGTTGTKIITGLRVLLTLLALLLNSVAPAVKMMLPETVTCGMACCLESGVCYCHSKSHARSGGESHKHEEGEEAPDEIGASQSAEMASAIITSSCPAQCAQLPTGFQKNISLVKARIPEWALSTRIKRLISARASHFARGALVDGSSVPRAPPVILL